MPRSADYTIQGFLYQFNKSIIELLNSNADEEVMLEGIIDDIDIRGQSAIRAIQCKYHEAQEKYTLSKIYKPILQMMESYITYPNNQIKYTIYAYFPGEINGTEISLTETELTSVLDSTDKEYISLIEKIKGNISLQDFSKQLIIIFGDSFDGLVRNVKDELAKNGFIESDIEFLTYPNAVNEIAQRSIKHDPEERKIRKVDFVSTLKGIKKTAVTKWTLYLKTKTQILLAKKKQLKHGLDINTRQRVFVFTPDSIDDFDEQIVIFINEYLQKYHYKPAHIKTPVFCFDIDNIKLIKMQGRLYRKGITANIGSIGGCFDESYFLKEPMLSRSKSGNVTREFSLRLATWDCVKQLMIKFSADDIFFIGENNSPKVPFEDVNIEYLSGTSMQEIKYLFGVVNDPN
jgi:hypothetical protein